MKRRGHGASGAAPCPPGRPVVIDEQAVLGAGSEDLARVGEVELEVTEVEVPGGTVDAVPLPLDLGQGFSMRLRFILIYCAPRFGAVKALVEKPVTLGLVPIRQPGPSPAGRTPRLTRGGERAS
jgi:hypothetical protein